MEFVAGALSAVFGRHRVFGRPRMLLREEEAQGR